MQVNHLIWYRHQKITMCFTILTVNLTLHKYQCEDFHEYVGKLEWLCLLRGTPLLSQCDWCKEICWLPNLESDHIKKSCCNSVYSKKNKKALRVLLLDLFFNMSEAAVGSSLDLMSRDSGQSRGYFRIIPLSRRKRKAKYCTRQQRQFIFVPIS